MGRLSPYKDQGRQDEARFRRLFREFEPATFERPKKEKLNRLHDDFKDVKIRGMVRDFIRCGITENITAEGITQIFKEQMEWLENEGELTPAKPQPPSENPKGDR